MWQGRWQGRWSTPWFGGTQGAPVVSLRQAVYRVPGQVRVVLVGLEQRSAPVLAEHRLWQALVEQRALAAEVDGRSFIPAPYAPVIIPAVDTTALASQEGRELQLEAELRVTVAGGEDRVLRVVREARALAAEVEQRVLVVSPVARSSEA